MRFSRDFINEMAGYLLEIAEDPMLPAYARLVEEHAKGMATIKTMKMLFPDVEKRLDDLWTARLNDEIAKLSW